MAEPNFRNRTLYHNDNLEVLRGINSGTIDLIATDPPFNKGRDFHATPESLAAGARFQDRWSWEEDVHEDWVDQIKDDWPAVWEVIDMANHTWPKKDMGAFLCFMGVRLIAMHRVLKDTGSLYLHCDPTASHYLKALLDAIFGAENFKNDLIWHYAGTGAPKKHFSRKHDNILFYAKSSSSVFNPQEVPAKKVSGWTSKATKNCDSVWEINTVFQSEERSTRTGYPTQKPVALYERIVAASSNPGDVVFDPFAGCATTCVAAEKLGRQWIGADIWEKAGEIVLDRLLDAAPDTNITVVRGVPERTDDGEVAAPYLKTKVSFKPVTDPWQKLSHREIVEELQEAQAHLDLIACAGCGRRLEKEFMQLDHIMPRADGGANDISNRILLCGPCNLRKSNTLTLSGLIRKNKQDEWMDSEERAKQAHEAARYQVEVVKDRMRG